MKNRVLSVLLSIGIILSNCSTGFIAIAEDDIPVTTETTETNEPTTEPTDVPSTDDPTANENEEDDPNTDPADNPNDDLEDDPSDNKTVVNVSIKENRNLIIYHGQENELDTIYNKNNNNTGKPRYLDYFEFSSNDWNEALFNNIELKFERVTEDIPEGVIAYTVAFMFKEDSLELEEKYAFEYDEKYVFTETDYQVPDISVKTAIENNGQMALIWENDDYSVSLSNEAESFVEPSTGKILLTDDIKSDSKYYLRNVNSDSVEYHAISIGYNIDSKADIEISTDAVISQDINFTNISAYNKNVQITITAFAKSTSANITLQNNNDICISEKAMTYIGTENGKNKFEYKYTFTVPSTEVYHISNLKAHVTVGSETSEYINLNLKDKNNNICNDLRLEKIAPKIIWTGGQWPHGRDTAFQIRAWDEQTNIVSVEYSFDKSNWIVPNDTQPPKDNRGIYGREVWFTANVPTNQLNSLTLYVKAIDEAGNTDIIYRSPGGSWAVENEITPEEIEQTIEVIKNIELYYYDATSEKWNKITGTSVLNSNLFGNAINKPLQVRVYTDSKNKIYVNNTLMKSNITTDSDTGEETFNYYYYTFETGTDVDIVFKINNVNADIPINENAITNLLGYTLKSNHLIIESSNPSSLLTRPDFASENVSVSNKWYGIKAKDDNKSFEIEVSDEKSGIKSIIISDGSGEAITATKEYPVEFYVNNSQVPTAKIENTLSTQNYANLDEKTTKVSVKIPVGAFADGDHTLAIIVYDNAGNKETGFIKINGSNNTETNSETGKVTNKPFTFSTDFTRPKGTISIVSSSKIIDGEEWFADSAEVAFDFEIDDVNPNKVVWKANSNAQKIEKKFESGKTVVSASLADTNAALDENNSYTISAVFYDQAGNSSEDDDIDDKKFYKDTESPTIDSVSVSHAPETGLGKVLRIITFGFFSNDNVTVSVKAHDGEHDSGLNDSSLKISLDGGTTYNSMKYEDGKYKYTIAVSDIPKSGIIAVRATDRFGNESEEFTVITSDGGTVGDNETKSKDFIIENIPPLVSITLPESDGITRTDGKVWYNSDKDITISVKDENSGIHSISVFVNDEQIQHDSDNTNFISNCLVMDKDSHEYRLGTEALREILRSAGKLPDDGHYTIRVEAEDNAGNKNDVEADAKDYYLDYVKPVVQKIDFSIPSADEIENVDITDYVKELQYGFYFKTDLVATVHVHDDNPTSDLYAIKYMLVDYSSGNYNQELPAADSDAWQLVEVVSNPENKNDATASFNVHENFKGQIFVMVYDKVLNVSDIGTPDLFVVDTPERHESEQHIEITGMGETSFTDAENNPLFSSDVHLTVRVVDTMSGIREISYSLTSENDTQDNKTITLENNGYSEGQDLGDGWIVKSMDENLVTEVERNYTFSADNNNIQLLIGMKDRSNNPSTKESDVFSVDQTAPIINVAFDAPAGNADCYREARTATITVIERNFDSARIIADIQNSFGNVPSIGTFTDASNTEHTATITFSEGDYTFSIAGTDRCDHNATINYSGGNEQSFKVDLTDPRVVHNFDQFVNSADNSFNTDKEMTITITEHNFVASLVSIRIYRTKAGQELTTTNREDCTSEYITPDKWRSNGDTHTISFTFSADYVYQVMIGGTDASGRMIPDNQSQVFEIDKTKPVLKNPENLDVLVYTSKNTETEAKAIEFEDSNIARVDYSVVSYQMKINEDKVGYDMAVNSKKFESKNGSVIISNEFFNQDGIYEVKCTPYDVAGNAGDETTHTYVIQRDTDFLVYIPNSIKENRTGLYKFDQTGIRSADFEDIKIISYITNDKTFSVEVDGVEVTGNDLDSKLDDRRINQVNMYDVTVKNSYIAQNFSEDTVDTDLTLNAVAKNGDTAQVITLGHIYIDNVKPMGEYEKALQDIGFFDGFYGVESKTLMIEGVSPDIDLSRCEILVNDESLTYENGGFQYDENAHTISFTINKGYTNIRPTLVDNAGNINNLAMIKKVYVGNLFARFWYLFIFGGLIVIAIPTLIILAIVRKKKTKRAF